MLMTKRNNHTVKQYRWDILLIGAGVLVVAIGEAADYVRWFHLSRGAAAVEIVVGFLLLIVGGAAFLRR